MSRPPDYMYRLSERLSEVMADIGVNKRLVMKRRRAWLVREKILSISYFGKITIYHFGSQSECTTTLGLESDIDRLDKFNTSNVIQKMSELKPGVPNLLMIQNENISPGYCHLQLSRADQSLCATANDTNSYISKHCVTDSEGRLLLKNTFTSSLYSKTADIPLFNSSQTKVHGPALTITGKQVGFGVDLLIGFYGESPPHQVTSWLQKQRERKWPTEDVLEKCRNDGCFVVPVGSKVAYDPELEWRISTSLQERHLMFSLYITQLRCYILMKMILKTHIETQVEDVLSSFMCKNVLLYCIANSSHDWHRGNLLSYLHLCLFMLKECVEQRNCPHFMIPENNLLAGGMTDTQRGKLLDIINNLMKNDEQFLYEIQIDDLGRRLEMKLNMISYSPDIESASDISQVISVALVLDTAMSLSTAFETVLNEKKHEHLKTAQQHLCQALSRLEREKSEGDLYQIASKLLIPFVSSTLGLVLASSNIDSHTAISDQAFTYLKAGKESDALSGRLKLVSVLYCTGDMERVESELRIIETKYNISELHTVCSHTIIRQNSKLEFTKACAEYNEEAIKSYVALCTKILQCEINCVPQELRYEILRSYIKGDRQMRTIIEAKWMDFIVVDSVPYLYFLQYKIYGHLQRKTEQQTALSKFGRSINLEPNLGHKEVALNLLGQCMEQENRQTEAFQSYIRSLKHRERNNAARFLLCIQLSKLRKQYNAQ